MAIVVVGGASKNVGKTRLMTFIISSLAELNWTAVKITQHAHGVPAGQSWSLEEEEDKSGSTDTSLFLKAGAARSFFLRAHPRGLAEAMPNLMKELRNSENSIFESNSVLEFLKPDLYLAVLNTKSEELKESAEKFFARADALVCWDSKPGYKLPAELEAKPVFVLLDNDSSKSKLVESVLSRIKI